MTTLRVLVTFATSTRIGYGIRPASASEDSL